MYTSEHHLLPDVDVPEIRLLGRDTAVERRLNNPMLALVAVVGLLFAALLIFAYIRCCL